MSVPLPLFVLCGASSPLPAYIRSPPTAFGALTWFLGASGETELLGDAPKMTAGDGDPGGPA